MTVGITFAIIGGIMILLPVAHLLGIAILTIGLLFFVAGFIVEARR